MSEKHHSPNNESLALDGLASRLLMIGLVVGVGGLAASGALGSMSGDGGKQFFHSYLLALMYFVSIALGALFFVTLQHLTRAGWSVAVRRLAEILAANLPILMVLFLPILVAMLQGSAAPFPWVDENLVQHDALLKGKQPYLNVTFFMVRFAFYFVVWWVLSRYFLRQSVRQDQSGELQITAQMQFVSAPAMMLFVITATFAAFDLLMSLEPHWFSTIFGVYFFAGGVLGFLALTILMCVGLQRAGVLRETITIEHYHDLGKLLFGFVFFWGYIAFSQFMLIWYGNIPEETHWYLKRMSGDWVVVSTVLLVGHFLIPFPGLLSRHVKRNTAILSFWAVYLLAMHWVDLYWLIMPSLREDSPPLGLLDVLCWLGVGGVFLANFAYTARGKLLLPVKDPRLDESLAFENV